MYNVYMSCMYVCIYIFVRSNEISVCKCEQETYSLSINHYAPNMYAMLCMICIYVCMYVRMYVCNYDLYAHTRIHNRCLTCRPQGSMGRSQMCASMVCEVISEKVDAMYTS